MSKPQVFIAKGDAPWYNRYYKSHAVSIDESISGQATVTCRGVTNMSGMFATCDNLTTLDLSNFNTSNVRDMAYMFKGCNNLSSIDFSNFDTFKVTKMNDMFDVCFSLTSIDLSSFDTSNVTNMAGMFNFCESLTTIKGIIDMRSCTDYRGMFYICSKLKGVKIKNPPVDFESETGLSSSQYTIVS